MAAHGHITIIYRAAEQDIKTHYETSETAEDKKQVHNELSPGKVGRVVS
jgi:hypothetical protein